MQLFKTILCLIDFNDHNDDIYNYTLGLAINGTQIIMAHAATEVHTLNETPSTSLFGVKHSKSQSVVDKLNTISQSIFAGYNTKSVIIEGNIDSGINEIVDKYCIEVIVIGSTSAKGLRAWLSENYFARIISRSRVPILVVPNNLSLECSPI